MDTAKPKAIVFRPKLVEKVKIMEYLKERQDEMTWTAFITGGFFDWALAAPGGGFGFDFRKGEVTIYDGGDREWETTNVGRIGEAVANALAPEYQSVTTNQIAYINSFTTSQTEILRVVEKVTGKKFMVREDRLQALADRGAEKLKKGDMAGALDGATASIMGLGGINQYSKERETWNETLGLKPESLEGTIERVIKEHHSGRE